MPAEAAARRPRTAASLDVPPPIAATQPPKFGRACALCRAASVKPGVVTGEALVRIRRGDHISAHSVAPWTGESFFDLIPSTQVDLLAYAKEKGFAIPAVNAVSSCGINACLEAAAKHLAAS